MSTTNSTSDSLSYRDAGVDIDAGNELVERIKGVSAETKRPEVMGGLGGFGALCKLPSKYKSPVLVSGTDGVGTKLKLAIDNNMHDGVGIDLVAMCVNDLLVVGAEPLFFLDYYATASLDVDVAESVIRSIAEGCKQSGAALIGGETAEMPGMYKQGDYDLAGFCVGVVEEGEAIDGSSIADGDVIIGVASSGPHSNGFSLIRKVMEKANADSSTTIEGGNLLEQLMLPTRIYVKQVLSLNEQIGIKGIAHITGGGLTENLPRVLPKGINAQIDLDSWSLSPVFNWLQTQGNIDSAEMLRTFNCGVGLTIIVNAADAEAAIAHLTEQGETAFVLGNTVPDDAASNNDERVAYTGTL